MTKRLSGDRCRKLLYMSAHVSVCICASTHVHRLETYRFPTPSTQTLQCPLTRAHLRARALARARRRACACIHTSVRPYGRACGRPSARARARVRPAGRGRIYVLMHVRLCPHVGVRVCACVHDPVWAPVRLPMIAKCARSGARAARVFAWNDALRCIGRARAAAHCRDYWKKARTVDHMGIALWSPTTSP